MVNRHAERKPWRGPLLKPRCSPLVRLGDIQVLDKRSPVAKVHNGAISRSWSAVSGAGQDLPEPRACALKRKTKSADVDCEDWPALSGSVTKTQMAPYPTVANHDPPSTQPTRFLVLRYRPMEVRVRLPIGRQIKPKSPNTINTQTRPAATQHARSGSRYFAEVVARLLQWIAKALAPRMNRRRNSPLARWGFSLVDRRRRQILALGVGLQGQWGSRRSLLEHKGTVLHTASDAGLECRGYFCAFR